MSSPPVIPPAPPPATPSAPPPGSPPPSGTAPRRWLRVLVVLFVVIALFLYAAWSTQGFGLLRPEAYEANTYLVEDFDGPAGTAPNAAIWGYQTGAGGWGNGELQTYTSEPANVALDGQGNLAITARQSEGAYGGTQQWTSARVVTQDRLVITHGTVTARIKVPQGSGIWPAFWMLGNDIDQVGFPESGEIDVLEAINDMDIPFVSLHGPTDDGGKWKWGGQGALPPGMTSLADDFVDYGVRREPGAITWTINGTVVDRVTPADLGPNDQWVFEKPMFLLLNVAVGGAWPGPPGPDAPTEATMLVDRVEYQPL